MASSKYFVKIKTPYNIPVLNVSEFYKLELFRSEFGVGSLYVDFPLKEFMSQNIATEWRLEVYRSTSGGELVRVGDTQWIVKLVRYKADEQSETTLHVLAYDAMYILDKRIVAYVDGTPYTSKTMPADDMIKSIVRENLGALATDYRRDLSEWLIVDADTSSAPVVTKSEFGMQKVMPVLNDICQLSEAAGMYLSYDIIYDESIGKLVFKTYTQQRGANHGSKSPSPIYLSHHTDPTNVMGDGLNYASIEIDASDERSYIYSGRQSGEVNAIFEEIGNDIALDSGPFARTEDFITTGESVEYNDVMTEAHAWLQEKFRNLIMNAHIQDTNDMQFGLDYGFGDVLAFRYLGTTINIHLDEFKIVLDGDGKEDISVTSTDTEKELLIQPLIGLDDAPLTMNEPLEDDDSYGVPLFYKHHTIAQSFIAPPDGSSAIVYINYAKVMMRRVGLPERSVAMRIKYDDGLGNPGADYSNQVIKTYDTFADGLYTWARFEFDNPLMLNVGQTYWITLTCGIAKESDENYYLVGVDPETRYLDGILRVSEDGSTFIQYTEYTPEDSGWNEYSADIPFRTYKNSIATEYTTIDNSTAMNNVTTEFAQQFWLPACEVTNLKLNLKRVGTPGDITVSISHKGGSSGQPGESYVSRTIEALDVRTDVFAWYDFQFSETKTFDTGKIYSIHITAPDLTATDYYLISVDTTEGYALGANYKCMNATWTEHNADIAFSVYKLVPDIFFETTTTSKPLDIGKYNAGVLQTFKVFEGTQAFKLGVYLARVGEPTEDISIDIYKMGENGPETEVSGITVDRRIVTEYFEWYEDYLNGNTLLPEETYCIRFSSKEDENNYYILKIDANESYINGTAMIDRNEAAYADSDMLFRIGQTLP